MAEQSRDIELKFLFPGLRGTSPITDAAVEKVLRVLEVPGTPHGFRTSFRTWVQDTQACSWEVAERARKDLCAAG
jgi:integrase